ncbi:MAG: hypothetical protein M0P64_00835 [Candidatus Pacebacteria bacterium]|jgi:transcription initiation factor TFIIIB Brf1 subunit/transcription initiation factor TFIIB|nr:hypothetical protein [Candidatus Paceibacterota bacterium]
MDAFAKMDIFFVVTTLAVIVIAIFVATLLYYILRTAKDVSEVVHIVRKESERFVKGASAARSKMTGNGVNVLQNFIAFVQSFASTKKRGKKEAE